MPTFFCFCFKSLWGGGQGGAFRTRAAGRKGKAAIGDDSDDEADLSDEGARRPKRKAKSAAGKGKKGPKAPRRGGARVEIEYENEMQSVASRGAAADW